MSLETCTSNLKSVANRLHLTPQLSDWLVCWLSTTDKLMHNLKKTVSPPIHITTVKFLIPFQKPEMPNTDHF